MFRLLQLHSWVKFGGILLATGRAVRCTLALSCDVAVLPCTFIVTVRIAAIQISNCTLKVALNIACVQEAMICTWNLHTGGAIELVLTGIDNPSNHTRTDCNVTNSSSGGSLSVIGLCEVCFLHVVHQSWFYYMHLMIAINRLTDCFQGDCIISYVCLMTWKAKLSVWVRSTQLGRISSLSYHLNTIPLKYLKLTTSIIGVCHKISPLHSGRED